MSRSSRRIIQLIHAVTLLCATYTLAHPQTTIPEGISQEIEQDISSAKEFEERGDYNQAAFHLSKAANAIWVYGDPEQAIPHFLKAIEHNRQIGNINAIYVLSANIGMIHSDLDDYQSALPYFAQATQMARQLDTKSNVASALLSQANASFYLDQHQQTLQFLEEAEATAKQISEQRLLRNIYSLYSQTYDRMGRAAKAAEYFELFTTISRRLQQQEIAQKEQEATQMVSQAQTRVSQVEAEKKATEQELIQRELELLQKQRTLEHAEQESQQRQMQIDLLNTERELQESIIKQQILLRNIFIVIIITGLIVLGLILYGYEQKKKANVLLSQKNEKILNQKEAIQSQAEQLHELNQLKDKLFSIISHDLRSPLSSLITLINLTKEGYYTEEGFKEIVNELSTNVGYTSSLLENLLKWAQSQMQGTIVNPNSFNLFQVVNEIAPLYNEQLVRKGINLRNKVDLHYNVYADKDMIDLVIRNLVSNAIKFSSQGDNITLSASHSNGNIEICIADTGRGIPPESIDNLFGKMIFSTRGTSDEKGTGLGLILCKDFIKLNGGDIWVKSEMDKGSEFYFTLPVA